MQNSSPILAREWWRHFRLSLSLSLSLCISLSHRMYLTHNIGSASALPIIRILRVSVSLGTKFQRNRLGRIWAQAGLRKGVVVSAISSVQNVWWDWSRLASRPSSISGTGRLECMQMNRCQGGKASRLVPSNRLFPMVTVTNWSPNRSTLNFSNFAVFRRIELKFVALENWNVPLFYSVIFIGKSWG